jgi:hypothetical protein
MKKFINIKTGVIATEFFVNEFNSNDFILIPDSIQFPKVIASEFENTRIITKQVFVVDTLAEYDEEGNLIISETGHFEPTEVEEKFTDIKYSVIEDEVAVKSFKETELYNQKNLEMKTRMIEVFGTSTDSAANRLYESWKLMLIKPDIWLDACGFTDEAQVVSYANEKIAAAESYGVWCYQRTIQFYADRALLNLL